MKAVAEFGIRLHWEEPVGGVGNPLQPDAFASAADLRPVKGRQPEIPLHPVTRGKQSLLVSQG